MRFKQPRPWVCMGALYILAFSFCSTDIPKLLFSADRAQALDTSIDEDKEVAASVVASKVKYHSHMTPLKEVVRLSHQHAFGSASELIQVWS